MKHNLNTKIIIFASIFLLILVANPALIAIGQEDTYTNDTSSSDQTPEEQTSENQTSGEESMSQNNTMTEESMTQEQTMMEAKSPKKQMDDGVAPNDVVCKEGLELLIKTSDGSAACVKSSSIQVLIARGWGSTPA